MADTSRSYLLDLQPELLFEIIRHLKATPDFHQDLCNWSSVSSNFRSFLGPYLFTSITLRNTERSGFSIALPAKSNYRQNVQAFSFIGTAPGDLEDGFSDTESMLPPNVGGVLSELSQFPQLESVCIQFPMCLSDGGVWGRTLFDNTESSEERLEAEREEARRALNTKVYESLARNVNPGLKRFELQNLIPAEASSFSTPEFRKFLGQMTYFTLSFWIDRSSDTEENELDGYISFTQRFDDLFFDHLSSVTHLSIAANFLPVGTYGTRHVAAHMGLLRMPLLKKLSLDSSFISAGLKELLATTPKLSKASNLPAAVPGHRVSPIRTMTYRGVICSPLYPTRIPRNCVTSMHITARISSHAQSTVRKRTNIRLHCLGSTWSHTMNRI